MTSGIFDNLTGATEKSDPIALVQREARRPLPRRFYSDAKVEARDGRFVVALDGKTVRTPRRELFSLPTGPSAEAVCAEWAAQEQTIDPATMPMTRIVNSALDGVAQAMGAVASEIAKYAASDVLCYRAVEPDTLVELERAAWDPVLDWADEALGARFVLAKGVMFVDQPAAALAAVEKAVQAYDTPIALACLHTMTTLTGSAVLALAVARGQMSVASAWAAAHVDEDYEMQLWGQDEEALERRAKGWREMDAAARLLMLVSN
jgi:chaperone required for assembly of F1-ATPase